MNMASQSRIAVAIGDPNGIGPEIAVKAAARFAGITAEAELTDFQSMLIDRFGISWMVAIEDSFA